MVIDEVIGQWIALAGAVPSRGRRYLAAFALFRLFDIWKPPPVAATGKRCPAAGASTPTTLMAGVYAALVLFAGRMVQSYY